MLCIVPSVVTSPLTYILEPALSEPDLLRIKPDPLPPLPEPSPPFWLGSLELNQFSSDQTRFCASSTPVQCQLRASSCTAH